MANAPTVKEPTDSDVGSAVVAGAPDFVHIAQLLKGTHASEMIQQAAIDGLVAELAASKNAIKAQCRVATTVPQVLSTDFENGDTIDGVVLATGDRVLIKNQSVGSENGIYTVNASGIPTRATDFDADSEVESSVIVYVSEGNANADDGFVLTNDGTIIVGTTALVFLKIANSEQYNITTITYAANVNIDYSLNEKQKLTLTGITTLSNLNAAAGKHKTIFIIGDTVDRVVTLPTGMKRIGAADTGSVTVLANKRGILVLDCVEGGLDANIWYSYVDEG